MVTTTTRSLRRPTGALYNPNRVRHRSTTTTTTTTQTPAASVEFHQQRLQPGARLVRRRKYGSASNRTTDSDATASDVQPSDSSNVASTDKGNLFKYTVLSTEINRHRVTLQQNTLYTVNYSLERQYWLFRSGCVIYLTLRCRIHRSNGVEKRRLSTITRCKCAVSNLKVLRPSHILTLRPPMFEATVLIINN